MPSSAPPKPSSLPQRRVSTRRRSRGKSRNSDPAAFTFVKGLAYFWISIGSLMAIFALIDLLGLRDGPGQLPHNQAVIPAILVFALILIFAHVMVLFRTKIGFCMGFIFSCFMLLGIPIGTILGIVSIKAFIDSKDAFKLD